MCGQVLGTRCGMHITGDNTISLSNPGALFNPYPYRTYHSLFLFKTMFLFKNYVS